MGEIHPPPPRWENAYAWMILSVIYTCMLLFRITRVTAFIDMPEMLYYMRSNYQYWKDLEEKGTISINEICKTTTTTLPKIPESGGNHWAVKIDRPTSVCSGRDITTHYNSTFVPARKDTICVFFFFIFFSFHSCWPPPYVCKAHAHNDCIPRM